MKKYILVILLLLLCASGVYAIVFHVLPAIKIYQTGGSLEESLVTVDSFDLTGGKKLNSVTVILNNLDTVDHTVNVYLSIEDIAGNEIGSGSSLSNVIPVGITSLTIPLSIKPQFTDVSQVIITVKKII